MQKIHFQSFQTPFGAFKRTEATEIILIKGMCGFSGSMIF